MWENVERHINAMNNMEGRVEHTAKEKEGLVAIVAESTKVIADLQTRLKESKLFVPDL